MELSEVVNTQYAFPVGFVLICAVLVFAFGFKPVEQPVFPHLSHTGDDRKQTAGKKRKVKDKKGQPNGATGTYSDDSSPEVKKESVKEKEVARRDKKQQDVAASESPAKDKNTAARGRAKESPAEEVKNRKNERNLAKLLKQEEKPVDFDEGEWEQALSRKDKKNRKKDELIEDSAATKKESPSKKKKSAKNLVLAASDNKLQEDKLSEKKDVLIELQTINRDRTPEKQTEDEKDSADATAKGKKKNKKKPVANVNHKVASDTVAAPTVESRLPTAKKQVPQPMIELDLEPPEQIGAVVFDELGDVWKEARAPKKSKKKVRREQ